MVSAPSGWVGTVYLVTDHCGLLEINIFWLWRLTPEGPNGPPSPSVCPGVCGRCANLLLPYEIFPTVVVSLLDFEPIVFERLCTPRWPNEGLGFDVGDCGVNGGGSVGGSCVDQDGNQARHTRYDDRVQTNGNKNSSSSSSNTTVNGDGDTLKRPTSFSIHRGKSCMFTADPANLERSLHQAGSLTLMMASRVSKGQVREEGFRHFRFTISRRSHADM